MVKAKVDGWWMQKTFGSKRGAPTGEPERMVTLYHHPPSALPQDCQVSATLNETHLRATTSGMDETMRLVFNTTLTVDVAPNDDELRKAFIELVTMKAREVYGPAAMLAKARPILKITETSREGMVDIDVFADTNPEGN